MENLHEFVEKVQDQQQKQAKNKKNAATVTRPANFRPSNMARKNSTSAKKPLTDKLCSGFRLLLIPRTYLDR